MVTMCTIWDGEYAEEGIGNYLWKPIPSTFYYFVYRSESEYLLTVE